MTEFFDGDSKKGGDMTTTGKCRDCRDYVGEMSGLSGLRRVRGVFGGFIFFKKVYGTSSGSALFH